jgi:hypothetical protein
MSDDKHRPPRPPARLYQPPALSSQPVPRQSPNVRHYKAMSPVPREVRVDERQLLLDLGRDGAPS